MITPVSADRRLVDDPPLWSLEVRHLLRLLDTSERDARRLRDATAAVLALLPPGYPCRDQRAAIARLLAARGITLVT